MLQKVFCLINYLIFLFLVSQHHVCGRLYVLKQVYIVCFLLKFQSYTVGCS